MKNGLLSKLKLDFSSHFIFGVLYCSVMFSSNSYRLFFRAL